MDWLKMIAPTIATAVAGPFGTMAYGLIAHELGVSSEEAKSTIEAGKLTAEQIASVQLAEVQIKAKAQELGLDFEQLAVADRKSARDMQSETKSFTVPVLAYVIVGSFVTMVAGTLLGWAKIDGALAGTLVGYLSAKCEQVVAFYFGSSASSQNKDSMLYQSTPIK